MTKFLSVGLTVCLVLLAFCSLVSAADKEKKTVFIVHSYSMKNICGAPQHQGVVEALREKGFTEGDNLVIHASAMDTKRTNNTPELILKEADRVLKEINTVKPDIVVVLDDNAFRTVGLELVDTDVDVVFSGMNGQPEDYDRTRKWLNSRNKPGHNITGVYEKLLVSDAFRVQKMILPNLEKILMVSDNSPTGTAVRKQFLMEAPGNSSGIEFYLRIARSWEEYMEIIKEADEDPQTGTIYSAATTLQDKDGRTHTTEEIIKWTVANSRTPGIPLNYSFVRLGMLGGAGVDFIAMGRQAGGMAARILKGTPAGDIPLEDAKRYALVFNLKRARELGLTIPNDMLMAADAVYK
ncbi:ABC transporter substrate binding protein [Maridesulfovibrio sp.]|uniref:ABC transporter substrate-binding protein n=1 Tax=Maridesulfovibrio sp. TaxID=2795000 RepID=UPI002A18DC49|nr:ABC transporter substrate binding protein [Maridesulfovibrio sp.]